MRHLTAILVTLALAAGGVTLVRAQEATPETNILGTPCPTVGTPEFGATPVLPVGTPEAGIATPEATPDALLGCPEVVQVTLTEFAIDMPTTVAAGEITFVVANAGATEHNFEVEGQGIEEEFAENLQPGETQELTLTLEPGTYEVYCPVGGHAEQGMELELIVTDG